MSNHDHCQPKQRSYLSYMLRLWRQRNGHGQAWQASLESPSNGRQLTFRTLEDLCDSVRTELALTGDPGPQTGPRTEK
jgi:hypothetical protein